jgi:hypothetical protein
MSGRFLVVRSAPAIHRRRTERDRIGRRELDEAAFVRVRGAA